MEQRTITLIINNAAEETTQELKAKDTFGNNEYKTNTIKTSTSLNVV